MQPSPPQYSSIGERWAGLEDLVVLDCLVGPVAPLVREDPVEVTYNRSHTVKSARSWIEVFHR